MIVRFSFALAFAGLGIIPSEVFSGTPTDLEGTWIEEVYRPAREEHPSPLAPRDPQTLVIRGNTMTWKSGDRTGRQSLFRFVKEKNPRALDLMTVVGEEFWLTRAICKVEGDTLTLSEGGKDRPRPKDFARYKGLPQEFAHLSIYKRKVLPAKVSVGQAAPVVDGLLSDGTPLDPKDFAGKVVLVSFWTAENASLERHFTVLRSLRREFRGNKGFLMVSIRIRGEWNDWLAFCQRPLEPSVARTPSFDCDPTWWQAFHAPRDEAHRNPFGAGENPVAFLIGTDGKILGANLGDDAVRDAVVAALQPPR